VLSHRVKEGHLRESYYFPILWDGWLDLEFFLLLLELERKKPLGLLYQGGFCPGTGYMDMNPLQREQKKC